MLGFGDVEDTTVCVARMYLCLSIPHGYTLAERYANVTMSVFVGPGHVDICDNYNTTVAARLTRSTMDTTGLFVKHTFYTRYFAQYRSSGTMLA
jgi:hypothetical protein